MKYFEGLNALRFIAAILVAINHSANSLANHHVYTVYNFEQFSLFQNGGIAVEFFFVLSGFLITSLLLNEINKTGTIAIKKFYIRRILRIWPLYYLLILFYFVLVPCLVLFFGLHLETNLTFPQFILYISFLPNVVRVLYPITLLNPLWSIGVEEQFYLIWAPIVKYSKINLVFIFTMLVLIKLVFNLLFLQEHILYENSNWSIFVQFISHLKFEAMAIGGIGAYLIQHKNIVNRCPLFKPVLQMFFFSLISIVLLFKPFLLTFSFGRMILNDSFGLVLRSFLFLYLILNVSVNKISILKLRNVYLNRLGVLSYGMYMYHISVEMLLINFCKPLFDFKQKVLSTFSYYFLFIGLTIFISYLSYHFIEKRFLKLKVKYM